MDSRQSMLKQVEQIGLLETVEHTLEKAYGHGLKVVKLNKREAKALLAAFDWCECDFELGKLQKNIRQKVFAKFPDLEKEQNADSTRNNIKPQ